MFKQKLKASLIHLAISIFVISSFLIIAFSIWYPAPYSEMSGLSDLLIVLIAVDLILGPVLTFIVFKKHKTSLKFDLSVIAAFQLAALGYGIFTIYERHPVYVVYAVDRFELVPAKEAFPERAKYDEFKVSKLWFPKLVYAKSPTDPDERNRLLFESLAGEPDLERRPEYYEPIADYADVILKRGIAPERLFFDDDRKQKLALFLSDYEGKEQDFAFLPLVGKKKDMVIALRRKTGDIVGTIDIDPWKKSS